MKLYIVQPGDFLLKIARQHGFRDYRTVYDDPANAAFRRKRPNPDVIFPGDQLVIPDKEPRVEQGATGQRHNRSAHGYADAAQCAEIKAGGLAHSHGGLQEAAQLDGGPSAHQRARPRICSLT